MHINMQVRENRGVEAQGQGIYLASLEHFSGGGGGRVFKGVAEGFHRDEKSN